MKVNAHFYLLNEHFSQEHADAQHEGQESEGNLKIEWEDELAISIPVNDISVHRKATYNIQGSFEDGEEFCYPVLNVVRFDLLGEDDSITSLVCSESVLDNFEIKEGKDESSIHIYMKEEEPFTNPIPGVYIALQDFPSELSK